MVEISASWGFVLSKLSQEMTEKFSRKLNNYKIDSRDYGLLTIIYNDSNMTQKDIGNIMSIDRTTMVQIIDVLEEKNIVERKINNKDRRQNIIAITDLGEKIVVEMWREMKNIEVEVIKNAKDYQKQSLLEIADILEENK